MSLSTVANSVEFAGVAEPDPGRKACLSNAAPLSYLGKSTGRCNLSHAQLLVAMRCFLDGSEGIGAAGEKWLTLAAYCATDSFWSNFETKWNRMLVERYPKAPYIHMIELLSRKDPFEWGVYGWTEEKIDQLVRDAVDVLQQMDKERSYSFVCTIDLKAREKLTQEGYKIHDPATACTALATRSALEWHHNASHQEMEPVHLFFDRGEDFIGVLKKRWLANRTKPGRAPNKKRIWDMIANIEEVDQAFTPPLQATDMIAWSRTRRLSGERRDWLYLADVIKVVPQSSILIDEVMMREIYGTAELE
jgi:hypothetical protein